MGTIMGLGPIMNLWNDSVINDLEDGIAADLLDEESYYTGKYYGDLLVQSMGEILSLGNKVDFEKSQQMLNMFMTMLSGFGGGAVGGSSLALAGGGSAATAGAVVVVMGVPVAVIGSGIIMQMVGQENAQKNADKVQKATNRESNSYKEVNIHGKINTELDEVDLKNKIIYEDKNASKLYMDNPDFPQTEQNWAEKQIFKKGKNRIEALQQEEFRLSSQFSSDLPSVDELKGIKDYVFRIDADTPELRSAVQTQLDKLSELFPDFNFSAIYGGQ